MLAEESPPNPAVGWGSALSLGIQREPVVKKDYPVQRLAQVTEHIFGVATEPESLRDLCRLWDHVAVMKVLETSSEAEAKDELAWCEPMLPLIGQAHELFAAMRTKMVLDTSSFVAQQPYPTALLNDDLSVHVVNSAGGALFGLSPGKSALNTEWTRPCLFQLKTIARDGLPMGTSELLTIETAEGIERTCTLSRLQSGVRDTGYYILKGMELCWTDELEPLFGDHFGLSKTERVILRLLMARIPPEIIAEIRGSKPSTVRTQIKSILRKTGSQGLSGLLGLIAGLGTEHGTLSWPAKSKNTLLRNLLVEEVQLADGSKRRLSRAGAADGFPVIWFNAFTNPVPSASVAAAAQELGLKIISVFRPDFVSLPLHKEGAKRRDNVLIKIDEAEDIEALLDALGLEKAIVVGQFSSAVTALHAAKRLPDRVRGLVMINSGLPLEGQKDFAKLPSPARQIRTTGRYFPDGLVLPFSVMHDSLKNYDPSSPWPIRMGLADSEVDKRLLESSEKARQLMLRDFTFALEDVCALAGDFSLWASNWGTSLNEVAHHCPVMMIDGRGQPHQVIEGLMALEAQTLGLSVRAVGKQADLILYDDPYDVLEPIRDLAQCL